jgi:quercetin dioxygenase-like cupin family protein
MNHYKLEEIPVEQVTELFSRRFFTGEQATFAFIYMKKGCVVPLHHHDSEQFSYCMTGLIQFRIGDKELVLKPGELVRIPSNVPHEAISLEDFSGIDIFSPIRKDWVDGSDNYLRKG